MDVLSVSDLFLLSVCQICNGRRNSDCIMFLSIRCRARSETVFLHRRQSVPCCFRGNGSFLGSESLWPETASDHSCHHHQCNADSQKPSVFQNQRGCSAGNDLCFFAGAWLSDHESFPGIGQSQRRCVFDLVRIHFDSYADFRGGDDLCSVFGCRDGDLSGVLPGDFPDFL